MAAFPVNEVVILLIERAQQIATEAGTQVLIMSSGGGYEFVHPDSACRYSCGSVIYLVNPRIDSDAPRDDLPPIRDWRDVEALPLSEAERARLWDMLVEDVDGEDGG